MKLRCPICKKVLKVPSPKLHGQAKFFPFCSERCKLIDLGAWLDAEYKVVSEPPDTSTDISPDKQADEEVQG